MNARFARLVPVLVASALASTACVMSVDAARYTTREEKRWPVTGTPDLNLVTFDGAIEVRSWDRPEVRVEIEKRAADKAAADAIEIRTGQEGQAISVEAVKPPAAESLFGLRVSPSARLVATVPRQCHVVARSGDGSIVVDRIDGRVDVSTGDGGLSGEEMKGSLRAHTGDGSIRFEAIEGTADADTSDGTVTLTGKLAGVRLRTGDGSVSVRADEGSAMSEDWEIRTGDGSVRVDLPEGFAASLDAASGDGHVQAEGFGEPAASGRGEGSRGALKRPIGPGGRLLRVRTGSGTIRIRKLQPGLHSPE